MIRPPVISGIAPAGDIDIYYERTQPERSGAPRLLFISGTGGDLRVKPSVFDGPLPKHFDVLAFDQRGLGQSSKPDRPYSMADYAADAASLMQAVGWDSALVMGVSFGGMVAQELAINHAGRVERLALACSPAGGKGGASFPFLETEHMEREARARHLIPFFDRRYDAAWAVAHPDQYQQLISMFSSDPHGAEPGMAVGRHRQLEARAGHDTWDRLGHIKCPTFVCGGRHDGIAPPETIERMAGRIPGAELRFFEGGHLFLMQDVEAYPAVINFLKAKK